MIYSQTLITIQIISNYCYHFLTLDLGLVINDWNGCLFVDKDELLLLTVISATNNTPNSVPNNEPDIYLSNHTKNIPKNKMSFFKINTIPSPKIKYPFQRPFRLHLFKCKYLFRVSIVINKIHTL
jgi:hypothetical protein